MFQIDPQSCCIAALEDAQDLPPCHSVAKRTPGRCQSMSTPTSDTYQSMSTPTPVAVSSLVQGLTVSHRIRHFSEQALKGEHDARELFTTFLNSRRYTDDELKKFSQLTIDQSNNPA